MAARFVQHEVWWPRRALRALVKLSRLPALALVRCYQRVVSKEIRSRQCRFSPSCSQYAYEAIDRHGLFAGVRLAHKRISRCNPRHPGGEDPVP